PAPAQYQVHPPRKNTTACFKTWEAGSVSSRNMRPASRSPDRATAVQRERPLSEMVFFDIAHRQVWTGWGVYNWLKWAWLESLDFVNSLEKIRIVKLIILYRCTVALPEIVPPPPSSPAPP